MTFRFLPVLLLLSAYLLRSRNISDYKDHVFNVSPLVTSRPLLRLATMKARFYGSPSDCGSRRNIYVRTLLLLAGDVELNPGPEASLNPAVPDGAICEIVDTSTPSLSPPGHQVQQSSALMPPDSGSESLSAPECPRCRKSKKRKRSIECNSCGRHWHLTCVRLSRAQADIISRWDCLECAGGLSRTHSTHIRAASLLSPLLSLLPAPTKQSISIPIIWLPHWLP